MKYLGQSLRQISYVSENFQRKFASIVVPPTIGTTKRLLHCKVHLLV